MLVHDSSTIFVDCLVDKFVAEDTLTEIYEKDSLLPKDSSLKTAWLFLSWLRKLVEEIVLPQTLGQMLTSRQDFTK